MVISCRHFKTTYQSHLQESRIQKESQVSQYGVYIGKSMGGACQSGSYKWLGGRCFMRKEILTSVVARNVYMREVGEGKGKESTICG